ncbi:Hpr(Ser) kinase/phosphatase [Rhizobium sp. RU35A]|uniref:HPr kinase/phosphorylase n=1 Tax=Rhizobium sp. RU35A TaxID=1907414 RepID=UPI000954B2F9|nr:HPr kinase/phosphorylase [Rhizobium sp. RU35A]SIR29106.1 Hpr(Ser) kinase/phosphatase [Rhizobium sp. RU35A]
MTVQATNVHGTAIVVGTRGLLFVGPSGSGKSTLAFTCLQEARRAGAFAALIADDQVFIRRTGDRLIAERPASIAGLIEIFGSGIGRVDSIAKASLDLVIRVVPNDTAERLPPDNEMLALDEAASLPLLRLLRSTTQPLALIAALRPDFRGERPFT